MNIMLNRLDPHVPDPVESRRRAAGRLVRIAYAASVFGVLGFLVVYFGRPLVYLSGPGVVSSPMVVVSLPYVVQVKKIHVTRGATVKAGEMIAEVWSPERENIIATHMRGLADLAARSADLRVKARVAGQSLETARAYLHVTEEAVERVGGTSSASTTFRLEVFRERAAARKAFVSQEAEAAEAAVQLATLDELSRSISAQLDTGERRFAGGRVLASISGIIPTSPAREGQSVVAGSPIAEIRDPGDIYINWYLPDHRLSNPEVGTEVVVLFGHRRIYGKVSDILRVSDVVGEEQPPAFQERIVSQVARVRFDPGVVLPPLASKVSVHMYYTAIAGSVAKVLIQVFGLAGIDDSSDAAPSSGNAN